MDIKPNTSKSNRKTNKQANKSEIYRKFPIYTLYNKPYKSYQKRKQTIGSQVCNTKDIREKDRM